MPLPRLRKGFWCLLVILPTALCAQEPKPSIARIWNEQNLAAIRLDFPNPPVHARNLFHNAIAMYDAWAAFDPVAVGYLHREAASADSAAARKEAISFAAYRVLSHRYAISVNAEISLAALRQQMLELGYDPDFTGTTGDAPAALGNRVATTVLAYYANDGSNEEIFYRDPGYTPFNDVPLPIESFGNFWIKDPNRWQPLEFEIALAQNGLETDTVQIYVGSHWGAVRPFAIRPRGEDDPVLNPPPPPLLGTETDADFKETMLEVLRASQTLDAGKSRIVDISPGAYGNNPIGEGTGQGHPINPFTGMPYEPNVVPEGDYGRVIAEYWADGPDSETPPGHWNKLANEVSDHPLLEHRMGGVNEPMLDRLEWDVKLYFALNAATHDAAIAAWDCKRKFDYVRPISAIRYMAMQGQSSRPDLPLYHEHGLPLISDLVEIVTAETAAPGGRHAGLIEDTIAVFVWGGEPLDPESEATGIKWIQADEWLPYQRDTFVTPAFPGYVSGHSTFSHAAAEVLARFTGTPFFPGGMGTFTAKAFEYLEFEHGPSVDVQLQWATYYDAADEAGVSRIYGGIHPPVDDFPGRKIGHLCGVAAYELALRYFDGSILQGAPPLRIAELSSGSVLLEWEAERGLYYQTEYSTDLTNWLPLGEVERSESHAMQFDSDHPSTPIFYRVRLRAEP